MASSTISRLRTLFANIPKNSQKILNVSENVEKTKPISQNSEKHFKAIVKKFIKSSRSERFRQHQAVKYVSTVRRLAAAKQYDFIEEIVESQKEYKEICNEGFTVRLLSLYGKSGMFLHARRLFNEMPVLGCKRTVKSFNALLSACVHAKEYEKIVEVFDDLKGEEGIEPNLVSYNIVVKAFCEMELFDSAFEVVKEMEKSGVVPDEVTFNTLLEGFYGKGMFEEAEKVWEMMKEKNVVASSRSFNPKIRGLVSYDRISEAIEVIDEMKRGGVEPDTFSYNALIKGFCDGGNLEEAKRWFFEMVKNKCKPERVTYVVLGHLACKMGDFGYAFGLCKVAIDGKFIVHKTMVQRVVNGLVKESKTEEAMELVELGNSNDFYSYDLKLPQSEAESLSVIPSKV